MFYENFCPGLWLNILCFISSKFYLETVPLVLKYKKIFEVVVADQWIISVRV